MDAVNAALAVLHIATGVFFTTTGTRKCFMPDVRAKVCGMFDRYGVPKPAQFAVIVGELLGGLGLLFGCLTHAAAAGLLIILAGAYKLDTWPAVKTKQEWKTVTRYYPSSTFYLPGYYAKHVVPASWSQLLSNALCTPEAQLFVILAAIALAGAGSFSIDALIWR
jgi:uncharacterized membrane protein YphA (DoxX/SURF4 family)